MNEDIEVKLREVYNKMLEKPLKVQEIFNDFYGEDKVDLQGFPSYETFKEKWYNLNIDIYSIEVLGIIGLINNYRIDNWFNNLFILVHFPKVRVTNENDKYVDITHLWAKIGITYTGAGKGTFGLNRSEYTEAQFISDYLHSHVSGIPSDKSEFLIPCTGTGPINRTLTTLAIEFDESIWQLFCLELDKYVKVESLEGIPYRKLEDISTKKDTTALQNFNTIAFNIHRDIPSFWTSDRVADFLHYLFDNEVLSFNYYNNQYGIAMSFTEYVIVLSNSFIEWYNKKFCEGSVDYTYNQLLDKDIIFEGLIRDNKIYKSIYKINNISSIYRYVGSKICTFKGNEITLNIIKDNTSTEAEMDIIINLEVADLLLASILKVINYNYGRNNSIIT